MNTFKNSLKHSSGYSITELIVVIAGISALAAFATPNVVRYVKEGQVDEAKALLNTAAAECGSQINAGSSASEISPNSLKGKSLPGLYKYTGSKTKSGDPSCVSLILEDEGNDESRLTSLGINISSNPLSFEKFAEYKHPDGELGCKAWSLTKCSEGGEIERLKAEAAARAAEEQRLREIEERYQAWLQGPPAGSGHYTADGKDKWAFQGREVGDEAGYLAAQEAYFGRVAMKNYTEWLNGGGDGNYKKEGLDKWAFQGKEVVDEAAYNVSKRAWEEQQFLAEVQKGKDNKSKQEISMYGFTKWVYNGKEFSSSNEWQAAIQADNQNNNANTGAGSKNNNDNANSGGGKNQKPVIPGCVGGKLVIGQGKNKRVITC